MCVHVQHLQADLQCMLVYSKSQSLWKQEVWCLGLCVEVWSRRTDRGTDPAFVTGSRGCWDYRKHPLGMNLYSVEIPPCNFTPVIYMVGWKILFICFLLFDSSVHFRGSFLEQWSEPEVAGWRGVTHTKTGSVPPAIKLPHWCKLKVYCLAQGHLDGKC